MKFPNHLMLDIKRNTSAYSIKYWTYLFTLNTKFQINYKEFSDYSNKFLLKKETLLINIFQNQLKYTLKYSLTDIGYFLSKKKKNFYIKNISSKFKIKNKQIHVKSIQKKILLYLTSKFKHTDTDLHIPFTKIPNILKQDIYTTSNLWNLFNINFLRKEKIYTKLKYSRTPQYDIVSGGVAAIFSGFLGFLICEKFGFELLDSGDFYILFMYCVFLGFFLRMWFKLFSAEINSWTIISFKWLYNFYKSLFELILNFNKKIFTY
uniref:Uncharacterized protein n=1 Tax=Pseudourostyla cristata TaxID=293816 RepID=A0A4P9JLD0_9SPIT|nr:hypothetical protein [Pseudourostyla cristata]